MISAASFATALGLSQLPGATLAEVDAAAALQHRTDRKYLVPLDRTRRFVEQLADSHQVLDLDGRRTTSYHSTYFDTPRLGAWRAHVQRRRRRWKVRTRLYAEDALCRVEVKTKDGRGATVKHALTVPAAAYGQLDAQAAEFVDKVLAGAAIPVCAAELSPAAEIRYVRAALADLQHGTRVTLDGVLTCHQGDGDRTVALDPGHVLVETKGGVGPAPADRLLLRLGARPVSLSKYIVGQALLTPGLPDNDVRRLARSHFLTGPHTAPAKLLERDHAS
ncbi:polyphosphate polymerase domain-containing protein [Streptomyces sp. NBC_01340]|uniref:polyphosphate polymerase domain-containing protein n=1 Tax=unclassified Streptomyces TaxID=2593676 RepID=UPI002250E342|nr:MULTISPECIES: polyphosphate polymerase domain-containing protein [unclassified Streptomyces]MCX4457847.1 polyphosphate polymerase domain-containing protein [Streptomyces sp. NBC_01719]MCX4497204.1 polyphosphate polymerase domain-containing protein [Streptomyces sp. NBC_01728]WSI42063.1 polyphosphate polymerase domain-containing protein [Streptomyces sp. NBC_01340]